MPSRTPRAATLDFVEPFGEVLRCVTHVGFIARGSQPGGPYEAHFQRHLVPLRRRPGLDPVRLRITLYCVIDGSRDRPGWWEARAVGWIYDIRSIADRPIFTFHWHLLSGRVTWPHLHAYGAHESVELHKLHAPTGHVTLSSIVRFLIEDLGVLPRRSGWQAVLDRRADV